jgi:hypothetical protein
MNRIKKSITAGVLLLMVFTMACKKKDIPKKDDKQSVECTKKGTIVPMDCVGNYLGIMDADNNYYYIEEDRTNDFSKYKEGDEICFDFELSSESTTEYSDQGTEQGFNFTPTTSIDLTCISDCHCQSDCKSVKVVSELPSDSVPSQLLDIIEMRQEGNALYLKLAYSGCDPDIDPDLFISGLMHLQMHQGLPVYECVVKESRVQLCYAHFVKEFCFDLSELEKKHQYYELLFKTREGSESIKIVH